MIEAAFERLCALVLRCLPPDVFSSYSDELLATSRRRRSAEEGAGVGRRIGVGLRELGGMAGFVGSAWIDTLRADSRGTRGGGVDPWRSDVRHGWAGFRRQPSFYVLAGATLALGIGANVGVLGVASRVLFHELPYGDADRLVRAFHHTVDDDRFGFSINEVAYYREDARALEDLAAYVVTGATLTSDDGATRVPVARVTTNLFSVLRAPAETGRTFRPGDSDRSVVVVSSRFRDRVLGIERSPEGASIRLDGVLHTVVGVMPPSFTFPGDEIDLWLPRSVEPRGAGRGPVGSEVVARLATGATVAGASRDLDRLARSMADTYPAEYRGDRGWGGHVEAFRSAQAADTTPLLIPLILAVLGVLLVTALNAGSLLLIRADRLRAEVGIRRALGAQPIDLLRTATVEALLVTTIGVLLSVPLSVWTARALGFLVPTSLQGTTAVNSTTGLIVSFIVLVVAALLGAGSWARALSVAPNRVVRGAHVDGRPSMSVLHGVCVVQVGVAVALAGTTGLLIQSSTNLVAVDLGFDVENVLAARIALPETHYPDGAPQDAFFSQLEEGLRSVAGVDQVGIVSALPLSGYGGGGDVSVEELGPDHVATGASQRTVTPTYFETIGIPLISGRLFNARDESGAARVAVVDRLFAERVWGSAEAALGRRIQFFFGGGEWNEIVGVVGHVHHSEPALEGGPQVYVPFAQRPTSGAHIVIRSEEDPAILVAALRDATASVDPTVPIFDVATLRARLSSILSAERNASLVFGAFAVLTLALATVGVYAAISLSSARRRREYGIRRALGARGSQVALRVLISGLRVLAAGGALGAGLAVALQSTYASLLFEVSMSEPVVWLFTFILLGTVGVIACLVPAVRATQIEPSRVMTEG